MRPIYVGKLSEEQTKTLKEGLRSPSAFMVRRCQILLKSAQGQNAKQIGQQLHCSDQAVRNVIRAYQQEGMACLQEKSHARHDQQATINELGGARLKEIMRLSPLVTKPVSGPAPCWLRSCIGKDTPAKWSVRVPSRRPYNGLALPGAGPRSGVAVLIPITNTEKKTGSVETMGGPTG